MASISLATAVLSPYTKNGNTGNCYEILFALDMLRGLGLSNESVIAMAPLFADIKARNARTAAKIDAALKAMRPAGHGINVGGHAVKSLRNVTQDDGDGGTGDLILVLDDGTERSVSIFAGKVKADGTIEKCLSNPTCTRYGCTADDWASFKQVEIATVDAYKKEMTTRFGANEDAWNRKPSEAAKGACSLVATVTAARFNALPDAERVTRMQDLLRIGDGAKPADMLCVVDPKCTRYSLFTIVKSNLTGGTVQLRADTFWLHMLVAGTEIGKTQVKFNNGVYHKGKTSSMLSSWNATCRMNKAFTLVPLTL